MSCASPPVSAKASGRPLASARTWILVESPPRKRLKQRLEEARLRPSAEATIDAVPAPVSLRHIDPACPGAHGPQNPVQDASIVVTGAAHPPPFGWQERGNERPLHLG